MFDGDGMSSKAFILSWFASIPRLLTIKPKNFSVETPKAHLARLNFMLYTLSGYEMPQPDELYGDRP